MDVSSGVAIHVEEPTDVAEARRHALQLAAVLALDDKTAGRLALLVTEAATNLIKHAGNGEIIVGPAGSSRQPGVQVVAIDRGHGLASVSASLRDGFSTTGTPGTGLGAIQRAANTFDIFSGAGGTVVAATVFADRAVAPITGGLAVPVEGETRCGDGWAMWSAGELTSVFVCDGLGHGAGAADAAAIAVSTFRQYAERAATEVVDTVHRALRATRGAAIAMAELDHREGRVRYCGLGNITGLIVHPDGSVQHLISHGGIAGHVARRVQEFTYEWPVNSLVILHSDGLSNHWSLRSYAGALRCRPDVIAGILYRDFRRHRDDASVVVARNGSLT